LVSADATGLSREKKVQGQSSELLCSAAHFMIRGETQKNTAASKLSAGRIGRATGLLKNKNGGRLSAARIFSQYFLKLL
jgi:hypothetical protein